MSETESGRSEQAIIIKAFADLMPVLFDKLPVSAFPATWEHGKRQSSFWIRDTGFQHLTEMTEQGLAVREE